MASGIVSLYPVSRVEQPIDCRSRQPNGASDPSDLFALHRQDLPLLLFRHAEQPPLFRPSPELAELISIIQPFHLLSQLFPALLRIPARGL